MKRLRPIRWPRRKPSRRAFLAIYRALFRHFGHRGWWPGDTPFEVMVGAILTQNTAWTNVEKAIQNLKRARRLNLNAMLNLSHRSLASLIRPAGYFNIKAKRLKNYLNFLQRNYQGKISRMSKVTTAKLRKELLEVNGVGEETADSILLYALKKKKFVVDAYTRRIFSRHRYLTGKEDYREIQEIFERILPTSLRLYNDYHAQIVEVGKNFCRSRPRCEACPLRNYL